ncbi:hypothetical protein [Desulforhopalus sp. IMCC35007]|uniref:hypothetical protein n=1 Tax=Desulforhopalus sp. IMCC35007 TaxID=2569543 RepID=UPI0010AE1A47|nr:hypothetical protein [Desulforhopalus sp. IMCC35007]TKB10789.1 hypothetical protein FCL48_06050 [Desulforhopalus sp. IMCC35007]
MIIEIGEKVHIVYRAMYEKSNRRHFLGEVQKADGTACRIVGNVFVYDPKTTMFVKKEEMRTTIIDLAASGYVVNVINRNVDLGKMFYKYDTATGLILTDGKGYSLNINEFGLRS